MHFLSPTTNITQAEPTTPSAVVRLTLNSVIQPVTTEQALPPKFNTPFVAGMYVNKHTMYRLILLPMQGTVGSSAADKTVDTTVADLEF